jgi:predicted metal-dependent hydrolase
MVDPREKLAGGLRLFEAGRYFEAHEEFESAWREAARRERFFLQGLIHCAAAMHHASEGNLCGAVLQARRAMRKLAGYLPEHAGLDTRSLLGELQRCIEAWQGGLAAARATIGVRR